MVNTRLPRRQMTTEEATIDVKSTCVHKGQTTARRDKNRRIKVRIFGTDVAYVGVKKGATLNLGNFCSRKVDVFLSFPCYSEEAADVFRQVSEMADELLYEELEELEELQSENDSDD
jgi:hypothetical protein